MKEERKVIHHRVPCWILGIRRTRIHSWPRIQMSSLQICRAFRICSDLQWIQSPGMLRRGMFFERTDNGTAMLPRTHARTRWRVFFVRKGGCLLTRPCLPCPCLPRRAFCRTCRPCRTFDARFSPVCRLFVACLSPVCRSFALPVEDRSMALVHMKNLETRTLHKNI